MGAIFKDAIASLKIAPRISKSQNVTNSRNMPGCVPNHFEVMPVGKLTGDFLKRALELFQILFDYFCDGFEFGGR